MSKNKKRVVLLSVIPLVLVLAMLAGVGQLEKHKPNSKEKKVISFVYSKEFDKYLNMNIIEGRDGSLEEFQKNATYYDIDGDGKKEILYAGRIGLMSSPGYVIYVFDSDIEKKPYIKAAYCFSNSDLDARKSKKEFDSLQGGIPRLEIKSGILYFRVLDSENDKKILNDYEFVEQNADNLIFNTHSDAGKCIATDYMDYIPQNE